MDDSKRQITKIAREAARFTVSTLRADGIGTAEFDFLHIVRKNPGITQTGVREALGLDKGAAARRAAALEAKGYLTRQPNPADGRSRLLYATPRAEALKHSKASAETAFYQWLLEELPPEQRTAFCRMLDGLYRRSKEESRAGFPHLAGRVPEVD